MYALESNQGLERLSLDKDVWSASLLQYHTGSTLEGCFLFPGAGGQSCRESSLQRAACESWKEKTELERRKLTTVSRFKSFHP